MAKQFFEVAKGLKLNNAVVFSGTIDVYSLPNNSEYPIGSMYLNTQIGAAYIKNANGWQRLTDADGFYDYIDNVIVPDFNFEIKRRGDIVGASPPYPFNDGSGSWTTLYDLNNDDLYGDFWSSKLTLFLNGNRLSDNIASRYQYEIGFCSNQDMMDFTDPQNPVSITKANAVFDYTVYGAIGFGPKMPVEVKAEYVDIGGVWHLKISYKADDFNTSARANLVKIG